GRDERHCTGVRVGQPHPDREPRSDREGVQRPAAVAAERVARLPAQRHAGGLRRGLRQRRQDAAPRRDHGHGVVRRREGGPYDVRRAEERRAAGRGRRLRLHHEDPARRLRAGPLRPAHRREVPARQERRRDARGRIPHSMTPLLTIARGDASGVSEPRRMIARSEAEWQTLWALHAGPDAASPAIDFAQVIAAAAFAGEKPSAGHSIEISAAPSTNGVVHLAVSERAPGPGTVAAAMITSPFHIVAVSREAGDVRWEEVGGQRSEVGGRRSDSGAASNSQSPTSAAAGTATGMEPRNASALAYLAGPFSGAMILFAESTHPDVRFHAWQ